MKLYLKKLAGVNFPYNRISIIFLSSSDRYKPIFTMVTYTLELKNAFQDIEFYFFTSQPLPSGSVTSGPFANTWTQATVPKGGSEIIEVTVNFYAC
jgi:hypothetical protein